MRFAAAFVLSAGAFALSAGMVATSGLAAEPLKTTPLSIEAIAAHPAIGSVRGGLALSPNGKYMVGLVGSDKHKWPVISIWDVENLSKAPVWIPSKEMRPVSVSFLGNDHIVFFADQPLDYTDEFEAGTTKTFTVQAVVSDLEGKKFTQPFAVKGSMDDFAKNQQRRGVNYDILQDGNLKDPNQYLVRVTELRNFTSSVYALDAKTLDVAVRVRGGMSVVGGVGVSDEFLVADPRDGELMVKETLRSGGGGYNVVRYVRNRANGAWEEHPELSYPIKQRFSVVPIGFFDADPNKLYVSTNRQSNFAQIKIYDIATRQWEPEPAFASAEFDIVDVDGLYDRETKEFGGALNYTVAGPAQKVVFVDTYWAPIQKTLDAQFRGNNVNISSRNKRLGRAIVTVSGPRQPDVYFLLLNGKELKQLGKSYPQMDEKTFGDTKYVTYKARDGMMIPGLLTLPAGYDKARHGRIPLVIHPHGGPWARDYIDWDPTGWTQFMATRGYAVLQPQYRGSEGWGMSLWKAGDKEWGQKMQDDKDDGAAWLVAEGIADPKRMAIFGYSYGGFAAIAASVRPNSPYQCAIAGAGVADLQRLGNLWGNNPIAKESQGWTVDGMDPLDNVAKGSIPILLYHGDRDTQAATIHSRLFYSAMKGAGKDVEYHEIKNMWHQIPWWPEWTRESLGYIESYLAGPKCFGGK
jgi:dipeptidyl aminopeptidase/acylaminoacyl peptidase